MQDNRLSQQIQFIVEIDKLKGVLRQTLLTDSSRRENSAEHSWHLAMMAMLLSEYAPAPVNVLQVIKMLLIHDLVEIDAGDTFCYDVQGNLGKAEREKQAAARLFGQLPVEQGIELRSLWEEFEAQQTSEAQFATALDRLQPLLHNQQTAGGTWRIHGITLDKVIERMKPIKTGAPQLWTLVEQVLEESVNAGYLKPAP
ncbi:HD domain-containing protein [Microcoleus sp. FACHB-SPT15]|jgi:putative hydrolase of HD superfamily|uniref:HD domain-containing protein n=1 Tax=Microcoleus sp. FACHB-SPT15 TaxID=2692830 RepID=UPI001785251F|nr:HD domain-containing protein [Microcoleus sp. FACHB-SPT15]MBD1807209.1 HD domain-containing protein [Microcoleus sp. FACHB-SPT15]